MTPTWTTRRPPTARPTGPAATATEVRATKTVTVTAGVNAAIPAVAPAAGQIGVDPDLAQSQDPGIARDQNLNPVPAHPAGIEEDPGAGIPDPVRVVPVGVGVAAKGAAIGALTITILRMDIGSMLPIWIAMLVKGTWKNYLVNMDP